jgi:hypothetical protein
VHSRNDSGRMKGGAGLGEAAPEGWMGEVERKEFMGEERSSGCWEG